LTKIVLDNLRIPGSTVQIQPGVGLLVVANGVSAHVRLNWHYRERSWPNISDGGSADIDLGNTQLAVVVIVGAAGGRPTVKTQSVTVNIGSININLHGGASWLYQIFVNIFAGNIKSAVHDALVNEIRDAINKQAEEALATIPIREPVDKYALIDYSLIATPTFTKTYLTSAHLGEFYLIKGPQEYPSSPKAMPDYIQDEMVQMFVSDYVANSAGFVYTNAGVLQQVVNDRDLPSSVPVRLNTSSFEELIPNIYTKYPNMLMKLVIYEDKTTPPVAKFSKDGILITARGAIDVQVITKAANISAFVLGVVAYADGKAYLVNQTLKANLKYLKSELSLRKTDIGDVDVSTLQQLVDVLIDQGVTPLANKYLNNGFPIPAVEGVTFVNPILGYGDDFISIICDLHYKPTIKPKNDSSKTIPLNILN